MTTRPQTRYWLQYNVGSRPQVWAVIGDEAHGLFPLKTGEPRQLGGHLALWDVIPNSKVGDFVEISIAADKFYRRIARPIVGGNGGFYCTIDIEDRDFIQNSIGQLTVFCQNIDRICRTVHPVESNFNTFGHDTRNLLILACTEVEAQWKGILRENGREGRGTQDYVLLNAPLKLGDYSLQFRRYPWLPEFSPFLRWGNSSSTTVDIPWYAAYNAVKHDRELSFSVGNIEAVFNAVAACAIMLFAQFGFQGLGYQGIGESGLLEYFSFSKIPEWRNDECYVLLGREVEPASINYPWPPSSS
jgi:hypothetical protein